MADNIDVLDGAAAGKTIKTTEVGGVHIPHHLVARLDSDGNPMPQNMETTVKRTAGEVSSIEETDGVDVWITSITQSNGDTTISEPVKQVQP